MRNATVIGGLTAQQRGMQPGQCLEYVVESVQTARGGVFEVFEIFKPYQMKSGQNAGQMGRGHRFSLKDGAAQIVELLNHLIAQYGAQKGMYVFQPAMHVPASQPHPGFANYPDHNAAPAQPAPAYQPPASAYQPPVVQAPAQPLPAQPVGVGGDPAWRR